MSPQQTELHLPVKIARGEEHDAANLATFLDLLHTETESWLKAADILKRANWPVTDDNKRYLRDLASQSDGQIISGQRGYRHIRHATADEIAHASRWLRHQAKEMDDRASAILRRYHKLPHSPKI